MAKKKIDLSRVKDFLFNHGEKVALGVCGFIAIVLGGMKLMDASSAGLVDGPSGKTIAQAFTEAKTKIKNEMDSAQPKEIDLSAMKPEYYSWADFDSKYVTSPYSQVPEFNDLKRRNPTPLKVLDDPKSFRLDYVRSLILVHDYDPAERTVKGIAPVGGGGSVAAPPAGKKPKGADAAPVSIPDRLKAGRAQTFVVVNAVFPMKQQVEEFRKALKLATQKELFDQPREDLPKFLGINVVRIELNKPGGTPVGKPEPIVAYENGRLSMQPALEKLLREAMYDDTTPPVLEPYLYDGLAMPLPKLAYGSYPKFQFPGWELAWGDDEPEKKEIAKQPGMKGGGGGGGVTLPGLKKKPPLPNPNPMPPGPNANANAVELEAKTIKDRDLREVDPVLSGRLFGIDPKEKKLADDFNVFHVLGETMPDAEQVNPPAGQPPIGPKPAVPNAGNGPKYFNAWDIDPPKAEAPPMPKGKNPNPKDVGPPPPPVFAPWERDALVRFIDADVKPGKTYAYAIQVRIANPNFKKEEKVAAAFLATVKELQDNAMWVTTPSITIPQNYFLYAMDQHLYDEMTNPAAGKKFDAKLSKDATTFQVHQWVTEKLDQVKAEKYVIGDWVVLERQVVHKGERIGATEWAGFPFWREMKEMFDLPRIPGNPKFKIPDQVGARIVLKSEAEAPVLVDFTGGKRLRAGTNFVEEETAVEALILTADGKLRIHNSRDDAEAKQPLAQVNDVPQTITRQERWLTTLARIREVLQATAPPPTTKLPGKQ